MYYDIIINVVCTDWQIKKEWRSFDERKEID